MRLLNTLFVLGFFLLAAWSATTNSLDQTALVSFFNEMTIKGNYLSQWDTDLGLCEQVGVGCSDGKVVKLELGASGMAGTISTMIGYLTSLTGLQLNQNHLSGSIPSEIGRLASLKDLDLHQNLLSGSIPTQVGKLTSLIRWQLNGNQLSGSIPTETGKLTSLWDLYLHHNNLSGPIPTEVGKLTSVSQLYLHQNQLSGPIPTEIGLLTTLRQLYLPQNQLSGTIPTEIGILRSLEFLNLHNNHLSGPIPTELGNLVFQNLDLSHNQLTGPVLSEFGAMASLKNLFLHSNNLTGTVPSEICNSYHPHAFNLTTGNNPHLCHIYTMSSSNFDDISGQCEGCHICENDGICLRGFATFTCTCTIEFMGPICQLDINRCRSDPCQHGGVCVNVINGFSCDCAGTGYTGTVCEVVDPTSLACSLGYEKEGPGANCTACPPGTFGVAIGSGKCVGCQKGTFSAVTAADNANVCRVCPKGSYSDSTHSTSCHPCSDGDEGCFGVVGSFASAGFPSSVSKEEFEMVIMDSDGEVVDNMASEDEFGYYYLGVFLGSALLCGMVALMFRKKFRRFITPVAAILKTPFSALQVLIPSGIVTEIPSFFRGLVGIWVIFGLILVTLYQIHVFATQRIVEISALQPGTVFTNETATSSTSSRFRLLLTVHQSLITTCDSSDYEFSLSMSNILPGGSVSLPVWCEFDSSKLSLHLSSSTLERLSFAPDSVLTVEIRSADGAYLFHHGVSFELEMDSFDDRVVVMTETLVPRNSSLIGGNVRVDLSLTPTELVTDLGTLSHGYSYSRFSSRLEEFSYPPSSILQFSCQLQVSESFYFQVKKTEAISGLDFVVGLVALASGVITGGSLIANFLSYLHKEWKGSKKSPGKGAKKSRGGDDGGLLEDSREEMMKPVAVGSGGKKLMNQQLEVPLLGAAEVL